MIIVITVTVFLLICIIRYCRETYSLFEKLAIPGPKPIWILGNIHQFHGRKTLDVFDDWYKLYGKIYGFYEGFKPSYVVCDFALAKQVLVKHFTEMSERPTIHPFVYYPDTLGLMNLCGQQWKQNRTVIASAFCTQSLHKMVEKTVQTSNIFMKKLSQQLAQTSEGFNIGRLVEQFSLDAFVYAGFGWKDSSLTKSDALSFEFLKSFSEASSSENLTAGIARIYPAMIPLLSVFDRKHRYLHERYIESLEQHILDRKCKQLHEENLDILGHLLSSTVAEYDSLNNLVKRKLTDAELCGHTREQMNGGMGTVSAVTSFVIYCLATNPEVQEKLIQEVDSICGQEQPDLEKLQSLHYMKCVIYETIRMFPVAPGVARVCTQNCTIDGIKFKKGSTVRVMLSPLYRDPMHFPDPDSFVPDRFRGEITTNWECKQFLPFGQGPRMCPGRRLGILICKTALSTLLQKYRVKTCSRTEIPLQTILKPVLSPRNGVIICLEPRDI